MNQETKVLAGKAKRRNMYIEPEHYKLLQELGGGNASQGIRKLIERLEQTSQAA